MRLRKAESAASVPPAAVAGSGLWLDGVGGGGPGNMIPPESLPDTDATAAPVEEEEEGEEAMEQRRPERQTERDSFWVGNRGVGLLGGLQSVGEQAILFWSSYGPRC